MKSIFGGKKAAPAKGAPAKGKGKATAAKPAAAGTVSEMSLMQQDFN